MNALSAKRPGSETMPEICKGDGNRIAESSDPVRHLRVQRIGDDAQHYSGHSRARCHSGRPVILIPHAGEESALFAAKGEAMSTAAAPDFAKVSLSAPSRRGLGTFVVALRGDVMATTFSTVMQWC